MSIIKVAMISGPFTGQEYSFDSAREFTFGRSPQADCCLEGDSLVSRMHASLIVDPATSSIGIKDLGSTNGFRINNVITGGKANPRSDVVPLADGDELMIGKARMRITIEAPQIVDDVKASETETVISSGVTDLSTSPGRSGGARRRGDFINIPGYSVIQTLGSGGMGSVFKAKKEGGDELVAIKVMTNNVVVDQKMLDMFQREIEVTKAVRHPNIVRFLDSGCLDYIFYLVIEFVGGGDLANLIKNSEGCKLDLAVALDMIKQVTDAMAYAHRKFLVHRDLKPSNILLDNSTGALVPKIADMGLAKNFNNSGLSGMTASFTRGGTMAYMPPEQLSDFRDVKPSADVFSLAATFYEMLCGRIVYDFREGKSTFATIAECEIRPIRDLNPDIPAPVARVLEKALSKNPDDRYQDAGYMMTDMYDNGFFN